MTVTYHNNKPLLVADVNEEFQFHLSYDLNPETKSDLFYTRKATELTDKETEIVISNYLYKQQIKHREYPLTPDECFYHQRSGGQSESSTSEIYTTALPPEEFSKKLQEGLMIKPSNDEHTKS